MKNNVDKALLQYALLLGISYQVYQTVSDLLNGAVNPVMIFNLGVLAMLLVLYFLSKKTQQVELIAQALHIVLLCAFIYFWISYGGFAGTVPLFLSVYFGFIIATSRKKFRVFSIFIYSAIVMVLVYFPDVINLASSYNPEALPRAQKSADFVIVGVIVMLFVIFLKNRFVSYRRQVRIQNIQLARLAKTLESQNEELHSNREEMLAINNNLEEMIRERTEAIELKSIEMEEYAFINAHLLRAPLCRILGLISIIEADDGVALEELRSHTHQLDQLVRSINEVVN